MERLKEFAKAVFVRAQRVLVPVMLFFVYFFVIGPMALAARLLSLLPESPKGPAGFWSAARRGPAGPEEAAEQS